MAIDSSVQPPCLHGHWVTSYHAYDHVAYWIYYDGLVNSILEARTQSELGKFVTVSIQFNSLNSSHFGSVVNSCHSFLPSIHLQVYQKVAMFLKILKLYTCTYSHLVCPWQTIPIIDISEDLCTADEILASLEMIIWLSDYLACKCMNWDEL